MSSNFSGLRTTEDILNALSTLYFNLNEIERIYYDMFINPVPMDVTFQRYDDTGTLETITLPNRAKDVQSVLTGAGDPTGKTAASTGAFYIDTVNYDLYFKSSGSDALGWVLIWSGLNMVEGTNFLAPDGNASQLMNLNMSNAGSGTLGVLRGGTGSSGITGIVKGNGSSAMGAAVDGVDYMGPVSMTGIIVYYPVSNIPTGWLMCDGSAYSRATYAPLFAKIGTTYGAGDGSSTFNVPNLMNDGNGNPFFIRCWDGNTAFNTVQQAQVGVHNHALTGNVGSESAHTHSKGGMRIKGTIGTCDTHGPNPTAPFYKDGTAGKLENAGGEPDPVIKMDTDRGGWTGSTSGGTAHTHSLNGLSTSNNTTASGNENRVLNKMLVPIIKY